MRKYSTSSAPKTTRTWNTWSANEMRSPMRSTAKCLGFVLSLTLFAGLALAHHSFTAEYDSRKIRQFTGTVTKIEWTNPHARFYLDVREETGAINNWNFELGSPLFLRKLGWKSDSLKVGD